MTRPRTLLALALLGFAGACAAFAGRPRPAPAPTRVPAAEPAGHSERGRSLVTLAGAAACAAAISVLIAGRRKPKGGDLE